MGSKNFLENFLQNIIGWIIYYHQMKEIF